MNVKDIGKSIFRDPTTRWYMIACLVLVAVDCAAILKFVRPSQSLNPLHYTIYFGIALTGPWKAFFWLPGAGAVVLLAHAVIAGGVQHPTWRRLWLLLAVMLNLLIAVNLGAIILVLRTATF